MWSWLYWLYFLIIIALAIPVHLSFHYDGFHSILIASVFVFSLSIGVQYFFVEYHGERDLFGIPHGSGKWKSKDHHQFKGQFSHGYIREGTHYFKQTVTLSKEREEAHRRSSSVSITHPNDHEDVDIVMEYNYEGAFKNGGIMHGKGKYTVWCSRPASGSSARRSSTARSSSVISEDGRHSSRGNSRGSLSETMLKHKCYSFEGTFNDGLMTEGTMTFRDGSVYTGKWLEQYNRHFIPGEKEPNEHQFGDSIFMDKYKTVSVVLKSSGSGKITYPDGTIYMGKWNENGKYHDEYGKLKYLPSHEEDDKPSSTASTLPRADKLSSSNIHSGENKKFNIYTGSFVNGLKQGEGELVLATGDMYIGGFSNDLYEGQGTASGIDGSSYHGEWKEGLRHGEGTMKFNSGNKYVGQFKANEFCGQGCLTLKDGTVYHEGIFPHNKPKSRRRSLI
jgi:hypothetical protein